jgi:biotin synthase
MNNRERIDKLEQEGTLTREELTILLYSYTDGDRDYAAEKARNVSLANYGNRVFFRGLIEISNYCKNDCYYCGIRNGNKKAVRYRLSPEDILSCCDYGYGIGFRTFVMQGGEDDWFTDDRMSEIIREIKRRYPDCAVTLSLGERGRESFQKLFDAGADRYLLRHETACKEHYEKLHPASLSFDHRMQCLRDLQEIGYQVGCGMMVGSPFQTVSNLVDDLVFMKEFAPAMIGIGPFIPHHDTPFRDRKAGTAEATLFLLSVIRLMHPRVLLPATTALGTVKGDGRELGVLAGANVVMPNISPADVRKNYLLYDNKIGTKDDASESVKRLKDSMSAIGYEVVVSRGDYIGWRGKNLEGA